MFRKMFFLLAVMGITLTACSKDEDYPESLERTTWETNEVLDEEFVYKFRLEVYSPNFLRFILRVVNEDIDYIADNVSYSYALGEGNIGVLRVQNMQLKIKGGETFTYDRIIQEMSRSYQQGNMTQYNKLRKLKKSFEWLSTLPPMGSFKVSENTMTFDDQDLKFNKK